MIPHIGRVMTRTAKAGKMLFPQHIVQAPYPGNVKCLGVEQLLATGNRRAMVGDSAFPSGSQPRGVQGEDGGGKWGAGGVIPQRIIHAEIKGLRGEPEWSSCRLVSL